MVAQSLQRSNKKMKALLAVIAALLVCGTVLAAEKGPKARLALAIRTVELVSTPDDCPGSVTETTLLVHDHR